MNEESALEKFGLRDLFSKPASVNRSLDAERHYSHIAALQDSRLKRGMDVARKLRAKFSK